MFDYVAGGSVGVYGSDRCDVCPIVLPSQQAVSRAGKILIIL